VSERDAESCRMISQGAHARRSVADLLGRGKYSRRENVIPLLDDTAGRSWNDGDGELVWAAARSVDCAKRNHGHRGWASRKQ
jgi:hypothetical protein